MRYECKAPEDTYELPGGVDIAAFVSALEISKYRTRIWDAGTITHIEVYSVYKTKEMRARASKAAKTNRAQANVNDRNARLRLERLVHINFREHIDLKIGLDYFEEPTKEQAQKNIAAFLRRYKAEAKKRGIEEIKYIYVTPWETKAGEPSKRLHHHIIITACGMTIYDLCKLWPHGRVHADVLQPDKNGMIGLAEYFKRHLHGGKRWVSSKNLIKPVAEYPSKQIRKTYAAKLAVDFELARDYFEGENPDYIFLGMEARTSSYVPGAYLLIRMRRRDAWNVTKGRAA